MKKIKEINFEARSKWNESILNDYKWVADQIKIRYQNILKDNEMLDLESLEIWRREEKGYTCSFFIRTMNDNTIIGSKFYIEHIPYR